MGKTGKKREKEQSGGQLRFPFRGLAREALWDSVILSGFGFVQAELEAERTSLCGERYAHQEHRQAVRAGHVPSSLVLGGRRVEIPRPRARTTDGRELSLPSWQAWSSRDALDERAFEHPSNRYVTQSAHTPLRGDNSSICEKCATGQRAFSRPEDPTSSVRLSRAQ